jgi:Rrf2 family transcriptional regulator, nitric oxide-sensitive transcriptional repressor
MNKIHRKVEYALIALRHMKNKKPGQLTTVKEICRTYGCSFDATSRVLQLMVQKGLLKSEQGAQGGYLIQKDLSRVNLLELVEMVVGPISLVRCLDNTKEKCEIQTNCNVIAPLSFLNDKIISFYKSINLETMLSVNDKKCIPIEAALSGGL